MEIGEQIQQLVERGKANVRSLPFTMGSMAFLLNTTGCVFLWAFFSRFGQVGVDDYRVIVAFFVPLINLFGYVTEINVLHFLSFGIWFTNFPIFAAIADTYNKTDGTSLAMAVVGYSLILSGETLSFLSSHMLWKHVGQMGDKTRRPLTLPAVVASIILGIGCLLLYYDTAKYNLIWSLPPLLIGVVVMIEIWVTVPGLAHVLCAITGWATYDILVVALQSRVDNSQWRSGAIAIYIGLVCFLFVLSWRTIERETSPRAEKFAAMFESLKRNIKTPPFAIAIFTVLITVLGAVSVWFQVLSTFFDLARELNFFTATMFFIPIINALGFVFGVPILHFIAAGIFYNGIGMVCRGIANPNAATWELVAILIGCSLSFFANEQMFANIKVAKSRFVDSVFRHPIFLISCVGDCLLIAGAFLTFFSPRSLENFQFSVPPLVLATFFFFHFLLEIRYVDNLLMFWIGTSFNMNSLSMAIATDDGRMRAGYSIIFAGLIFILVIMTWKKFRHPDEPDDEMQDLGYEEI